MLPTANRRGKATDYPRHALSVRVSHGVEILFTRFAPLSVLLTAPPRT